MCKANRYCIYISSLDVPTYNWYVALHLLIIIILNDFGYIMTFFKYLYIYVIVLYILANSNIQT